MKNLKPRLFAAIFNTIICFILVGICYIFSRTLGNVIGIAIPLYISTFILGFIYSYKALITPRTSRAYKPAVVGYFTVFFMFVIGGIYSFIAIYLLSYHNCHNTALHCYGSLQDIIFLFFAIESIAIIYAAPLAFLGCFVGILGSWLYKKVC